MNSKQIKVNIDKLIVYENNPRHLKAEDETEAIKKLCEKVTITKMYNLAKDISNDGLLPNSFPVVVKSDIEKDKYIVYDGNRRITAIKLMLNPEKYSFLSKHDMNKFKELSKTAPTSVNVTLTNEEDAFVIMKKTHSGEAHGVGLTPWGSQEKARFNQSVSKETPKVNALIIEYANKYFPERDINEKISYTSLARILYKSIKDKIGFDERNENSFTKDRIDLMFKVCDLVDKKCKELGITASRLNKKTAETIVLPFLDSEIQRNPLSEISKPSKPIDSNDHKNDKSHKKAKNKEDVEFKKKKSKASTKSAPAPYFMEGLDLSGLAVDCQAHHGMINLGNELISFSKDKKVSVYPYAAAYLLRAFIESVIICYLKTKTDENDKIYWNTIASEYKGAPTLKQIIVFCSKQKNSLFESEQKRVYENWIENYNHIIDPINLMVHYPESYKISPSDLIDLPSKGLLSFLNSCIKYISGQNLI